jgi:hypothetical protein
MVSGTVWFSGQQLPKIVVLNTTIPEDGADVRGNTLENVMWLLCTIGALKSGLDEDNKNGRSCLLFLLLVDAFATKICNNAYIVNT